MNENLTAKVKVNSRASLIPAGRKEISFLCRVTLGIPMTPQRPHMQEVLANL